MDSDRKGIYGEVMLGGATLKGWQMFPLPLSEDWAMKMPKTTPISGRPEGIFRGRFRLDHPGLLGLGFWLVRLGTTTHGAANPSTSKSPAKSAASQTGPRRASKQERPNGPSLEN